MTKTNLVLLPGMLCNELLWQYQMEHLSIDGSLFVGDLMNDDTIEKMAHSVLEQAPEQFALAGFSMGGIVAAEIARHAPNRVTKLALLDTNPFPLADNQISWWNRFIEKVERDGFLRTIEEQLIPSFTYLERPDDAELTNTILQMADNFGKEKVVQQIRAIQRGGISPESLRQLSCPTILIVGKGDKLCPVRIQEEIIDVVPHADLHLIGQCGHLSPMEQPQEVTALLQMWLSK